MARWLPGALALTLSLTPALLSAQAGPSSPATPALVASASASVSSSTSRTPGQIDAAPEQVVWLRSGAVVRGRIVEFEPERKVVLQLPTGEIRTIAWTDVERASWIATSPKPQPTPRTSAIASAASAPPAAGRSVVRIFPKDTRIWLETRPAYDSNSTWTRVCQAPCDRPIEIFERSMRIGGPELRPSNPFRVIGEGNTTRLVVSPGKASTHSLGRGMLVSGVVLALASGALYGIAKLEDRNAIAIAGITGMIASGVLVLGSLPVLNAGRTTVKNAEGVRVGKAPSGPVF
jgi:hypothetical protein